MVLKPLGVAIPRWQDFDAIVLSPGVPPELPGRGGPGRGPPGGGGTGSGAPFITRPLLAVSGTNGKTTTTTLLGELLTAWAKALVGGNIGTPVVDLLARQEEADLLVLEVSSFQLDTAPTSTPRRRRSWTSRRITWTATPTTTPISPPRPACSGARRPPTSWSSTPTTPRWRPGPGFKPGLFFFRHPAPGHRGLAGPRRPQGQAGDGREEDLPPGAHPAARAAQPGKRHGGPAPGPERRGRPAACREVLAAFQACPTAWNWWPTSGGCRFMTIPRAPTWARWPPPWPTLTGR